MAERLIEAMLVMLKPGGKLLVGNFAPTCHGRGYMELFLDWTLIYRNGDQLSKLFGQSRKASVTSLMDPHNNVVYAEWVSRH